MKKYIFYTFIVILVVFLAIFVVKRKQGTIETTPAAISVAPTPQISTTTPLVQVDPRLINLQTFLDAHSCVDAPFAQNYLAAADKNGLDYRLLPALSYKEELCTKNAAKNNLWGWESGDTQFSSIAAGIDFVADELNSNHFYRDKLTTAEKLAVYNGHPGYVESVENIMSEIAP